MIFKQYEQVLNGTKTQTRRASQGREHGAESIHTLYTDKNRIKWQVGRTYAVVPKRGAPGLLLNYNGDKVIHDPAAELKRLNEEKGVLYSAAEVGRTATESLVHIHLYRKLCIRLTAMRAERLHDITEADAIAEGVNSVEEYKALWESINGKSKGIRWADNPIVFVLTFEAVTQ